MRMHIVLVPGLWLDASSWDAVTPHLEAAGHTVHALTLPGLESRDADRSSIGLADHVAAVVAAIDACDGPVLLVGHSLGSSVASLAVDARPDRVARAVYIGGFPATDGEPLAGWATAEDGEFELPPYSELDEADLRDLDEAALEDFRRRAIPSPGRLTTDPAHYTDDRRNDVPVTAICPEYTAEQLRGWVEGGEQSVAEFTRVKQVDYVDVPTGHWPQFTRPEELARAILDAVPA